MDDSALAARTERVRQRMGELEVDVLLLSLGADLPWLTGYQAMPLERLTMLVLPVDGEATLVVPRLEAPRVDPHPDLFGILAWDESEDPIALVADLAGARRQRLAVSDRTWATFVLRLQDALPECWWLPSSEVTSPLRAVKDPSEVDALRRAAAAADRVAAQLVGGDIPLIGRTEAEVSRDIGDRLLDEGHQKVNFAIVGSGPNSASPHHEPGARVIGPARPSSATSAAPSTATAPTSPAPSSPAARPIEFRDLYDVLEGAQAKAVDAATVGTRARTSTPWPGPTSPTPATASSSSTAPATASAWRSTRTPTSSAGTPSRCAPATPSRSSPASTSRAGSAPASRTSWSPPTPAPSPQPGRPRPRLVEA